MPVTARLSQRFYDRFGDDITNELVDWFNKVDSTYQNQVREINESNRAWMDARFQAFDARFDAFEARVDGKLAAHRAELIRWMFVLWIGTVVPLGGFILALANTLKN